MVGKSIKKIIKMKYRWFGCNSLNQPDNLNKSRLIINPLSENLL